MGAVRRGFDTYGVDGSMYMCFVLVMQGVGVLGSLQSALFLSLYKSVYEIFGGMNLMSIVLNILYFIDLFTGCTFLSPKPVSTP